MTLVASRPRVPEPSLPAGAYRMLTDERLAKLAANGNRAAFEAIYARYHDTLFRYCRSLVREDEDARDALQNTMLNAMAAMHRRDRNAPLRPWLFRIAHNESISLLRRRRPSDSLDDDSEPHRELADGRADVHESAVTREKLDQLLEDLGELTDRQRGALLMRELGGLGYGEIAAALDTSEPAVRQSVFAARSALHESAEGRDLSCSSVQSSLSAGDRRSIRGRRVSAHLRSCPACRDFSAGIRSRRAHFGLLGPAPALAASMLQSILGAGGGAAGGAAVTAAGGSAAAGSIAAKALVALAAVGAAAGGTVELTELPKHDGAKAQTAAVHRKVVRTASAPAAVSTPVRRVHSAPVARKRTPSRVVHRQVKTAPVSYHWRGAHSDPSGPHAGTTKDPYSPKFRTLVRQDQSLEGLLAHTNASMLAARMIEQWKAQQRARVIAELQQRIAAQQQAQQQAAQPEPAPAPAESQPASEPDPSSSSDPAPTMSAPADSPPAEDPAPADSASQDSDGGSSADTGAE